MTNRYFPDEEIDRDDLYFICYMIERVARKLHQRNQYVVNTIGKDALYHLLSVAGALHCENPLQVEMDWIDNYHLEKGNVDVTKVDETLAKTVPSAAQMGKVYVRLIENTAGRKEDYVDGILRVYNNPICETIDNYSNSAYYEPSYVIAKAYLEGGF